MNSSYQKALDLGFTDDQILEHFSQKDPEFKVKYDKAIQLGHTPQEIFDRATYASERKKLDELQEEDLDKEIARHTARLTSRGIEQVVGAPGNIRDFAKGLKDLYQKHDILPKKLKKVLPEFPQIKEEHFPETLKSIGKIQELGKEKYQSPLAKTIGQLIDYFPTSSQLKEFSEEKTKGYTKPQGEFERIGDEVFEKLVSSALPGQGQRNIFRNIAAPIVGVLGKEAVKYMGGGEKSQALTELGLNITIPLMAGNAPQLNRDLWQDLRRNIPNVNINTNQILTRAQNLRQRIQEGLGSRSENEALRTVNELIEKLERGTINARELVASNISLNEIVGDPALFGRGGPWFEEVRDFIQDGMELVGHQDPAFYQRWQRANEIHGAIANSNFIANTIRRHSEPLISEGARAIFGAATHATAKAAAAIPPIYLVYKGTQVLNRMANSPHLLQYYTNVLVNSLRGNVANASANLEKLDKALYKEEQKEKNKPPFKSSSQKK